MDAKEAASLTHELLAGFDPANPAVMADELRVLWLRAAPSTVPELEEGPKKLMQDWGIEEPRYESAGVPVPVLNAVGKELGKVGRKQVDDFYFTRIRSLPFHDVPHLLHLLCILLHHEIGPL